MDFQKWPWQCQRVCRYPRYRKIFPTMELTFECVIGNDYEVSSKSQWRNRIRIKYCRDTGCIIPCSYKKYYKTKVGTLKSTSLQVFSISFSGDPVRIWPLRGRGIAVRVLQHKRDSEGGGWGLPLHLLPGRGRGRPGSLPGAVLPQLLGHVCGRHKLVHGE